ncbi:MAG: hypothetical protein ACC657_05345 [Thiohalomonadales bacterium]
MKLILVITGRYTSCKLSQKIWQDECLKQNIDLDVIDLENENGKTYSKLLNLKSFPALIFNKNIIAVGHPDVQTAENIITDLISESLKS